VVGFVVGFVVRRDFRTTIPPHHNDPTTIPPRHANPTTRRVSIVQFPLHLPKSGTLGLSCGVCATVDGRKNSHTLSPLARVVMHLFQSEETRM
jgi:hypothetical protein